MVTEKGYNRIYIYLNGKKKAVMEHRFVWENCYGRKVPAGYDIHHKDGNKLNNDIVNLELLDRKTHKRIHGNCFNKQGIWYKKCSKCGETKSEHEFYKQGINNWLSSECKACHITRATSDKKKRKK